MASLDYRFHTIKECSSCGALYTKSCACSNGGLVDKFVHDPNKTPDSSQRPLIFEKNYPNCGDPVDGLYCRQCSLLRKKLEEVWFTISYVNEILNTSELSNDNTNVVNVPQEPFVFNQDPDENSSQSPPLIDHHCCYGYGDSLDGIFCQRCTCESCGNGAYYGYNCPPQVPIISNPEPCNNHTVDELPQTLPSFNPTCYSGDGSSFTYDSTPNFVDDSPNFMMISKSHLVNFSNPLFDINDDCTSSDDESFSKEDVPMDNFKIFSNPLFDLDEEIVSTEIDSLLDEFASELTLLKSIPPGIDDDNLDSEGEIHLVERLLYDNSSPRPSEELNVENYIESFSPSLIPVKDSDSLTEEIDDFLASDGSIPPGIKSDDYDSEGDDNSTSLPEFESFHVDYPDSGDSTIDVVEDIPVDVPNILPTHPTLHMDFDFIPSHNDLGSDLDVSLPSGDRYKIYDS
ncbi:hypothetical protein Tco_0494968 [Tanacetum coccineum]